MTLDADQPADWGILRLCLLDFIADFANSDNGTVPAYLEISRSLTQVAHNALTNPDYQLPKAEGGGEKAEIGDSDAESDILHSAFNILDSNLPRPLVVDPFVVGGSRRRFPLRA